MEGEGLQELALNGEILHELRGQLYEIPPHVGAREALEPRVGEHAVQ